MVYKLFLPEKNQTAGSSTAVVLRWGVILVPQETLPMSRDIFACHNLRECYWFLDSRCQVCCWTSYNVTDSLTQQRTTSQPNMSIVPRMRKQNPVQYLQDWLHRIIMTFKYKHLACKMLSILPGTTMYTICISNYYYQYYYCYPHRQWFWALVKVGTDAILFYLPQCKNIKNNF